jgi:transposase InsO family protein
VSPGHKRQIAEALVTRGRCSERAVCRHFDLHRSTFYYEAKEPDAWLGRLKAALRRLSRCHPEWGYAKIARLLKADGWGVGARLIQRLRRELGLAVPPKKPRQRRRGVSTGLPTKATHRNHVWSWDFVHDTTMRGGTIRLLTVIDEYTRECRCLHVDRSINAQLVRQVMARLIEEHGPPECIRSDNGSEFIEKDLRQWLGDEHIKILYIEPGSPWQNGFVESFHSRLRQECLDREQLWTLSEARVVIEDWRWKYNNLRPHRSLGYVTPMAFAQTEPLEELSTSGLASSRPTASLRPTLDFLYNLNHNTNPPRLTI